MADPYAVDPDPAASGSLHRPRRSACADASLRAELERLRALTVTERIEAGERLALLGRSGCGKTGASAWNVTGWSLA